MRILLLVVTVLLFSCRDKNQDADTAGSAKPPADTLPYYDLKQSVLIDISNVAATPGILIYKISETDGKRDSTVIDTTEFKRLAEPFLETELNMPAVKKQYKESVFEDRDTKSFVFNYETDNPTLPVKSIAILVDNQYQDFKRADLLKSYQRNDTVFEERLAWTAGKKFQLIRTAFVGTKEAITKTWVGWQERRK
ncbi:MAG TPA: hypothetical protein VF145_13415 [Chitinophagaceae bacterium]